MRKRVQTLDVREDIRQGREPFGRIMGTVSQLGPDEDLVLLAPFEPVPLYALLARQGFHSEAEPLEGGDFKVRFTRQPPPNKKRGGGPGAPSPGRAACKGPPAANGFVEPQSRPGG
jgi:uncharacterized protein (DUF2249 family)